MRKRVSFAGYVCACLALSVVGFVGSAFANCPGTRGDLAQGEYFAQALRYMSQVDKAYCQPRRVFSRGDLVVLDPKFPREACEVVREALDRVRVLDELASTGPLPSNFNEFMDDMEARMKEAEQKATTGPIHNRRQALVKLNEVACGDDPYLNLPQPGAVNSSEYTSRYEAQGKCFPLVVAQIMDDAEAECDEMSSFMSDLGGQLDGLEASIRERMKPKSYSELKGEGF